MNRPTISQPNTTPSAHICINKSRMKIYHKEAFPTYYLTKGTTFSIELANPTTDVVLAKVILNGKAISQGGLVLNPGQRVFLERYLDVAKKFLFDIYEVSGSEEIKKAIADNGDIKVEFYKERQQYNNYLNGKITLTHNNYYDNGLGNYHSGTPNDFLRGCTTGVAYSAGICTTNGMAGVSDGSSIVNCSNTTSFNIGNATNTSSIAGASSSFAGPTMDSLSFNSEQEAPIKRMRAKSLSKQSIETGRVEEGSKSDQEFKYVNKSFEYYPFHTVEYKMLPVSQKVNTSEDINVKVYCTQCGGKLGKTDKFCSSCGKKA